MGEKILSFTETVGKSLEVEEEERSRTRVIAPVVQARKSVRKTEPGKKSTGKVTPQAEYGNYLN